MDKIYIEWIDICRVIDRICDNVDGADFDYIKGLFMEAPAVRWPVVRAEWQNMNDDLDFHYRCTNCGEETWQTVMGKPRYKYCPMCGAWMCGDS